MSKELFVTSTPHETRVAVVEDDQLVEIYYERENEYTLAGSIYKGKVTRVLPGMQSAFVEVGLERDAFLYVTDFTEEIEATDDDLDTGAAKPVAKPFEKKPERSFERGGRRPRRSEHTSAQSQARSAATLPPVEAGSSEAIQIEGDFTSEDVAAPPVAEEAEAQPTDDAGTRRWRGRRGRRRGRGGRGGDAAASSPSTDRQEIEPAGPLVDEAEFEEAEAAPVPEIESKVEPATPEPVVERPRRSMPEKIVLPGESLRKYGAGQESAPAEPEKPRSSARAAAPTFRPSTEISDPTAFLSAGHGVLAGESLAKYRNRPAETAPPVEPSAAIQETVERREVRAAFAPVLAPTPAPAPVVPHLEDEEEYFDQTHTEAASSRVAVEAPPAGIQEEKGLAHEVPPPAHSSAAHAFGDGVVEEEEISEEEDDSSHFGEMQDEAEIEELEEEMLEADEAENKEDFVIAAGPEIAAAFAASRAEDVQSERLAGVAEDEETDEAEEIEAGEEETIEDEAEFAQEEAESDEQGLDPEHPEYEGSAELRAPAATAGFQQKTADRGFDRSRRGRGGRRVRRVPPRRNFSRGPVPQIGELLKEGQEILVQIAKEPMAKKGARITSHIALPGRFLVYMPTVNHTGVSRKIGSDEERRRLKHIMISEKGEAHGGFIVRTAASGASEEDLRADIRFLLNLWSEIKGRAESSKAPALIYHDLNLVERILRDQVSGNFAGIWVDTEQEYERVVRFVSRFQPSLVKRVKLYTKETPLFEQFGIQDEINKALKSKVWLKSGGYIVINQTEALVAIDINTGKYVGKTGRLEDTIVKTNIDAIQEIVRQIRLRDLGGIIIIDFIDMDERKNRQKVMQALEEALKADRSPTKVLQFNDFGLVAITRKRVKQSLERTLSTSCIYCQGTGMIKSVATVCNEIYVELRKMIKHLDGHQIMLRVNPDVAKALKDNNGRWLNEMEELINRTIIVKSDPAQHQEQFEIL
ncbi:MAG: Rne/Rng family ribonuclease [Acidobacteriales bacterium]|nr:Rne/Rng family ribonuclease [Terriglobales bacterium]